MAEAADRLEALVAEVGVVLAEHGRGAHHLVDAGRRGERGDVDVEALLELDQEVEEDGSRREASATRPASCQKCGSSSRAVGPRAGRVDDADPLGEDAEAALAEQLAGVVLDLARGPASARRRCGRRRRRRRGSARGRGRRRGPPRPRSCAGCRSAARSRRPRRRRCRRGGASSAEPGSLARSARGWASRPCARRRRSRRRPCLRRSAAIPAAGRHARASSARRSRREAHGTGCFDMLTSRFPRLLRAGARRVDESENYRAGRPPRPANSGLPANSVKNQGGERGGPPYPQDSGS